MLFILIYIYFDFNIYLLYVTVIIELIMKEIGTKYLKRIRKLPHSS